MGEPNSLKSIQERLTEALNWELSIQEVTLLMDHLAYVLEKNKAVNLTRIDNPKAGILFHIEDSLAALPEIAAAPEGALVDMGSGGGYPGIPLAIVSGRRGCLIEATKKKAAIIEGFLQKSGLSSQIRVEAQRIEEVSLQHQGGFSLATARALSSLPALLELAAPLLMMGGELIAYKGREYQAELEGAKALQAILGMEFTGKRELVLSDGITTRTLLTFTKTAAPNRPLPRRPGQAQTHPLLFT